MKTLFLILFLSFNFLITANPTYDIREITSPKEEVKPMFINNRGEVAGEIFNGKNLTYGFIWNENTGLKKILPKQVLGADIKTMELYLNGLNDDGKILGHIGHQNECDDTTMDCSFVMHEGQFQFLMAEGENIKPVGINAQGQILGYIDSGEGVETFSSTWNTNDRRIFVVDADGFPQEITLEHSLHTPLFIDQNGRIGFYSFGEKDYGFFVWENGQKIKPTPDLFQAAFNQKGTIAEAQTIDVTTDDSRVKKTLLIWSPDQKETKSFQYEVADLMIKGMNDQEEIVGSFEEGEINACFWSESTGLVNLNHCIEPDSGWELEEAYAINNAGQIVGIGKKDGRLTGFILTPK